MNAVTPRTQAAARRRPRDRKAQIIAVAADQFYRLGYHNVGTEDVASAVGITAGALYRHFRTKQELLARTIIDGLDRAVAAVESAAPDDLDAVLTGLATRAVERRDMGILWTREARHLSDEQRTEMRTRFFVVPSRVSSVLRTTRPDLSESAAELLAWAVLAVLTSPSYHATEMPDEAMATLLHDLAATVCDTNDLGNDPPTTTHEPGNGLAPNSRREALLSAATRLFNQHGYHAVSMDDIGAAVGIKSASVYNHFAVKSDLLSTALTRAAGTLQLDMSRALAAASTARDALHGALDSYIALALSHSDLIGALVSEVMNLPDQQRHEIRHLQHDYVAEWGHLLRADRPTLDEPTARFTVHATLTVINDIARTGHLRQRPDIAHDLHVIATALLDHRGTQR
jgi:AcrR family transcriptional regulator